MTNPVNEMIECQFTLIVRGANRISFTSSPRPDLSIAMIVIGHSLCPIVITVPSVNATAYQMLYVQNPIPPGGGETVFRDNISTNSSRETSQGIVHGTAVGNPTTANEFSWVALRDALSLSPVQTVPMPVTAM